MDTLRDETFRGITELMYSAIGLSFTDSKKPLVSSRLAPRIQRLGMGGFEDYLALISSSNDGGEFQVAVDLLTTNETYFFREPAHYDLLQQELLRNKTRAPSIWSAASSFGDEAYSIAMLLADMQTQGSIGPDWRILLPGRAPEYAHELGALGTGVSFDTLKQRAAISETARMTPADADFSTWIRHEVPAPPR